MADEPVSERVAEHLVGGDEGVLDRARVQGLPAALRGRRGEPGNPLLHALGGDRGDASGTERRQHLPVKHPPVPVLRPHVQSPGAHGQRGLGDCCENFGVPHERSGAIALAEVAFHPHREPLSGCCMSNIGRRGVRRNLAEKTRREPVQSRRMMGARGCPALPSVPPQMARNQWEVWVTEGKGGQLR